jgi:hypothetical protein
MIDTLHSRQILLRCALLLGGAIGCAGQPEDPQGDSSVVTKEVVDGDLRTSGRRVLVDAEVKGDVAAAGTDVSITAPVDGYVMGAGRVVTLAGPIGNDLWAAGERVSIDNRIGNNVMAAGRTVRLLPTASVGQNAKIAGEHVTSEARIDRNLTIRAGTAEIGGEIGGTVEAYAGRVTVLPGTIIHGDLSVRSSEPPEVPSTAKIMGEVRHEGAEAKSGWAAWPWFWLAAFASLLFLGLGAVAVSRTWTARVADTIRRRTALSLGMGLLVLIAAPIAVGLLLVTVIGIPLAAVLFALYVAAMILSGVFVSYRVGQWLFERGRRPDFSPWAAMVVGASIVSLGITLPFVGWVIAIFVLMLGAGALAVERRDTRARVQHAGT